MTKLFTIGGYTVRCRIKPISYPEDHFWLQITSTYASSRWPEQERNLFGISLSRTSLTKLASIINLALAYTKGVAS